MQEIDPNVVIVCVTLLLLAAGVVCAVCGTVLVSVWYLCNTRPEGAKNTTESGNTSSPGISGSEANVDGKKHVNVDFEDLSTLTDDQLLNEFNKFESKAAPRSTGIVQRKQRLSEEIHKRNKAAERRAPQEESETV